MKFLYNFFIKNWFLNWFSFYVNTFDWSHCIQQVFNKECLLNINWEWTQVFGTLFNRFLNWNLVVIEKTRILWGNVVMIQMRSFEKPIWQVRNTSFDYFKHTCFCNFWAIRRNKVFTPHIFNLKEVAVRGTQTYIIKRSHLIFIIWPTCIQDLPLSQFGDDLWSFFIFLVFLHSHLTIAFKSEEVAFSSLQANTGSKSNRFSRISVFKLKQS